MKQIPSDKYNIAWFTLAECVSRGEKVRALSLYRLLAHSIDDHAFTSQLKGDLLLAFRDTQAVELYEEAAEFYLKDNRALEAVAVYEHLLTLNPKKQQYLTWLIKLYKQLGIKSKVVEYLNSLLMVFLTSRNSNEALEIVKQIDEYPDSKISAEAHQQLVFFFLNQEDPPSDLVVAHSKKVVDYLTDADDKKALQQFLTMLDATNSECYRELCAYLESSDK